MLEFIEPNFWDDIVSHHTKTNTYVSHHYRELQVHSSKVKKQINGDESRTITHEQTSKIITHPNGKKINESRENG